MNFLRQRQLSDAPRGDEMQFDAAVILLSGGAKADVSDFWRDPRAIGAGAARAHHGDGINEAVVARRDVPSMTEEQLFDEQFEGRRQFVQAAVDGLIRGQGREPRPPMMADIIIDAALRRQPLEMPEQIHG